MAARKTPSKFLSVNVHGSVLSKADSEKGVIEKGFSYINRYGERGEAICVYQLVSVVKPKPIEYITETFAVCKAPPTPKKETE